MERLQKISSKVLQDEGTKTAEKKATIELFPSKSIGLTETDASLYFLSMHG